MDGLVQQLIELIPVMAIHGRLVDEQDVRCHPAVANPEALGVAVEIVVAGDPNVGDAADEVVVDLMHLILVHGPRSYDKSLASIPRAFRSARSFRRPELSSCRTRSRLSPIRRPMASSVSGGSPSRPKRRRSTVRSLAARSSRTETSSARSRKSS